MFSLLSLSSFATIEIFSTKKPTNKKYKEGIATTTTTTTEISVSMNLTFFFYKNGPPRCYKEIEINLWNFGGFFGFELKAIKFDFFFKSKVYNYRVLCVLMMNHFHGHYVTS